MIHPHLPFRDWLLHRARELGFARAGFAGCEPFHEERDHLLTWIEAGGAKHLPYLSTLWDDASESREAALQALLDPHHLLPSSRTALVGFFPYARPEAIPGAAPRSAKVSRYLWGPDYHMVMKGRLGRLLQEAQARMPELEGRVCVDTAPILERQLAVRAGLGWQGKHTLLIAGKDGSWGFLGVLLLSAELPVDVPFTASRCGSCTACIDACPGGAITPFRVDPNRCLTTYTLETEALPPADIAQALTQSRWIAGCDACQEVCPWNRHPVWGDPSLWGGDSPLHTLPIEALALNGAQYRKHIRRTALRRVRHRQWLTAVGRLATPEGSESI